MFKQLLFAVVPLGLAPLAAPGCVGNDYAGSGPPVDDRLPVADAYLNRSYQLNGGLLAALGSNGLPLTSGPEVDPMIIETRRFYDTLQYPGAQPQPVDYPDPFTGQQTFSRATAPLTFDAWKNVFGFSPRNTGETVDAWRVRTGVVVYYNQNELGLGRELACAEFVDSPSPTGGSGPLGVACFVTNYGAAFNDERAALVDVVAGVDRKNTVAITFRPSLEPDYGVQFYSFASDGKRIEWAQLDTLGPRPHPHVCMDCHGGTYDTNRHLARGAHFLPLDPQWLEFADDSPPHTRAAQEERIRVMNHLALRTPITDAQREYFTAIYGGSPGVPGKVATPWVPVGWAGTTADQDLYRQVVRPYCGTCHLAAEISATGAPNALYGGMGSRGALVGSVVTAYLCSFQMPNAQPTMNALWHVRAEGVTIGGRWYPAGADALLAAFTGTGRRACSEFSRVADCRRGPDPDALCGDARSGMTCDASTGQCVSRLR